MASVTAMLNDLREIRKEQEAADGSSTLKASYAAMTDDIEIYDWKERQWWELTSTGELRISDGEGGADGLELDGRERPKLFFDDAGKPALLLNGVRFPPNPDSKGIFTFVQPVDRFMD